MLEEMADRIVHYFSRSLHMTTGQTDICRYGCESFIYSVVSTTALLIIGWFFGALCETTVIVLVFYCCQSLGGGFHATSHFKCFSTMAVVLSFCYGFLKICDLNCVYTILAFLSFLLLLCIPVQLHDNKHYLCKKQEQFAVVSRSSVCVIMGVTVYTLLIGSPVFRSLCMGLTVSSVSRVVAKALKKERTSFLN